MSVEVFPSPKSQEKTVVLGELVKFSNFTFRSQVTSGVLNSEITIGNSKLNLKTALLQFVLVFVVETAPGSGSIGKSE